ncbi:MAG: hypothetical protein LUD39_04200 [Opitutae bacterium]|nr:hypothetical protein [Opitutae bacterium]
MTNSKLVVTTLVAAAAAITTIPALAADLTWAGDGDGNVWSSDSSVWSETSATFANGDNVAFDSTGSDNSTVTLGEDITAGTITVSTGGYTFSGSGYTLTASQLALSAANSLTIDTGLTVDIGYAYRTSNANTIVVNGSLNVDANYYTGSSETNGGLLTIGGGYATTISGTGSLSATTISYSPDNDKGNLTISVNSLTAGDVTLSAGANATISSNSAAISTMTIGNASGTTISLGAEGSTYTIGNLSTSNLISGSDGVSGTLSVVSGATVNVTTLSAGAKLNELSIEGTLNAIAFNYSTSYGSTISGSGTLSVGTFAVSGTNANAITISVDTLNIDSLTHEGSHEIDISSNSATIGSIANSAGTLTISSNSAAITSITNSGNLTISSETANVGSIESDGGSLKIYATRLNLGGDISGSSAVNLGEGTTIGLADGTTSVTVSTNLWIETNNSATIDLAAGQSMTVAAITDGSENTTLYKTGEGALTITGNAAGEVVVSEGTLSLGSSAHSVTVDGGQLVIADDASVTVTTAITVVLDSYVNEASLALARADTTAYAIVLGDNASLSTTDGISITASDDFLSSLTAGQTYEFDLISGTYSDDIDIDCSGLESSGYTVTFENGIVTIETPEPSMFGVLAGLGALALVATRRRRSRKA